MEWVDEDERSNKVFNVNVNSFGKPHIKANSNFSNSVRGTKSLKRPCWIRNASEK